MSDHLPMELQQEVTKAVNLLEKTFARNVQGLTQKACGDLPSLYAVEMLCSRYMIAVEQQRDAVRRTIYETMMRV